MLFPLIRRSSSVRYLPQQQHRLQQSVLKTFSFFFSLLKNTSCNIVKRCTRIRSRCSTRGIMMMKKTSQRRSPKPPGNFQEEEEEKLIIFFFLYSRTDVNGWVGGELFDASSRVGCDPAVYLLPYIQSGGLCIYTLAYEIAPSTGPEWQKNTITAFITEVVRAGV